jgi:hypothetical protein
MAGSKTGSPRRQRSPGVLVREGDHEGRVQLEGAGVELAIDARADETAEDGEADLVALGVELRRNGRGVLPEVGVAAGLVERAPARADDGAHLVEGAAALVVEEGARDGGAHALGAGEAPGAGVGGVYSFDEACVHIRREGGSGVLGDARGLGRGDEDLGGAARGAALLAGDRAIGGLALAGDGGELLGAREGDRGGLGDGAEVAAREGEAQDDALAGGDALEDGGGVAGGDRARGHGGREAVTGEARRARRWTIRRPGHGVVPATQPRRVKKTCCSAGDVAES